MVKLYAIATLNFDIYAFSKDMTKEESEKFAERIVGKTLTNIDLYNLNDTYVMFSPTLIMADGAVELKIGEEYVTMAFNFEKECLDTFSQTALALFKKEKFYKIEDDVELDRSLIGSEIKEVEPFWAIYTLYDEDGNELPEKDYFLEELRLKFWNGRQLQLATVDYKIVDKMPEDVKINFHGEIMVNLGEPITIE